ncbi:MAG: Cthe_2314 family HEPN domain-containing protein [Actinomycetota bacterium]|nr:Cthe_2314 family HEPN domain-containing protein [Actinomycetota bacterium]
MNNLHEHAFMRALGRDGAAIIGDVYPDVHTMTPARPFRDDEIYSRACLIAAGELVVICDQLEYALSLLSGYSKRATRFGELITRSDYIAYQIENLYLRTTSVTDRALILSNEVLRLGLTRDRCRWSAIIRHVRVESSPVLHGLNAIGDAIEPSRSTRNVVAHHERYSDEQLSEIEMFSLLEKSDNSEGRGLLDQISGGFRIRANQYVALRRSELAPEVDQIRIAVVALMDVLLPEYEAELASLRAG